LCHHQPFPFGLTGKRRGKEDEKDPFFMIPAAPAPTMTTMAASAALLVSTVSKTDKSVVRC
jgi:hypothetical protein